MGAEKFRTLHRKGHSMCQEPQNGNHVESALERSDQGGQVRPLGARRERAQATRKPRAKPLCTDTARDNQRADQTPFTNPGGGASQGDGQYTLGTIELTPTRNRLETIG